MNKLLHWLSPLSLAAAGLLLTACSSTPSPEAQTRYYVLDEPAFNTIPQSPTSDNAAVTVIGIGQVNLAEFLAGPSIALQTSDRQIHKANYHHWAEPLAQAIPRVLQQELHQRLSNQPLRIETLASSQPQHWQYRLDLQINRFNSSRTAFSSNRIKTCSTNSNHFNCVRRLNSCNDVTGVDWALECASTFYSDNVRNHFNI